MKYVIIAIVAIIVVAILALVIRDLIAKKDFNDQVSGKKPERVASEPKGHRGSADSALSANVQLEVDKAKADAGAISAANTLSAH